ncbi:MAG TPA: hypothetical protein VE573_04145 [Nitrososphaeraceae archaeon]|nr:hypothetical protein [Nitrososphaeraceae archaeon]
MGTENSCSTGLADGGVATADVFALASAGPPSVTIVDLLVRSVVVA